MFANESQVTPSHVEQGRPQDGFKINMGGGQQIEIIQPKNAEVAGNSDDEFLVWFNKKAEQISVFLKKLSMSLGFWLLTYIGPVLILSTLIMLWIGAKKVLKWIWTFAGVVVVGLCITIFLLPQIPNFIKWLQQF